MKSQRSKRNTWLVAAPAVAGFITALSLMSCSLAKKTDTQSFSEQDAKMMLEEAHDLRAQGRTTEALTKEKEAADHFARMGELLMVPEGIQYADEMFAKALELDPANGKALFYKSSTEPALAVQGMIPRVERIVTEEDGARELERLREGITKLKMPELERFANTLPNTDAPFTTYYDAQRFLRDKMLPVILASADKLGKIDVSTTPLKLNFTPERILIDPVRRSGSYDYHYSYCHNDPRLGWKCEVYDSHYRWEDKKLRNEYFLDKYDLKILKASMMAMADQIRLATAYSQKDSEFAIRRLRAIDAIRRESGRGGLSSQDVVNVLREFRDLLTLEKDHELTQFSGSLGEILRNALEFSNMKEKLCNKKDRKDNNSLFHPICISAEAVDSLRVGLDLLAGPKEIDLGTDHSGHMVRIVADLSQVLRQPPKDLKALLPISFDEKGHPVDYPDATMGGLFPNGDFIEKFKQIGTSRVIDQAMDSVRSALRVSRRSRSVDSWPTPSASVVPEGIRE